MIKNRLRKLEAAMRPLEQFHFVIWWDNGDGTETREETGEVRPYRRGRMPDVSEESISMTPGSLDRG